MDLVSLGFQLMAYGLLGVFSVIILFYATTAALVKFLPEKEEE